MNSSHVSPDKIKIKIEELLKSYQNPEDEKYLLQERKKVDGLKYDEKDMFEGSKEREEVRNKLDEIWKQLEGWELIKKQNTTDTIEIEFVNRKKERERIVPSLLNSSFYLINAPSGYGKTRLLRQVQKSLTENGDTCFYISILDAKIQLARELIKEILRQLKVNIDDENIDLDNSKSVGQRISDCIVHEPQNVIFLIDNGEFFDASIEEFFNKYYAEIYEVLSQNKKQLYIMFAGRYIHEWGVNKNIEGPILNPINLTPFDFRHVYKTLQFYDKIKGFNEVKYAQLDFAAIMMHYTGGHPGCIVNFLKQEYTHPLKIKDDIDYQEYYKTTERIINAILEEIKIHHGKLLYESFLKISVFRKYNLELLEKIIVSGKFEITYRNAKTLESDLRNTYLLDRKDGEFFQDDIVRRLFCIKRREELKDAKFAEWSLQANQIYKEYLEKTSSHIDVIALEALYQELHYQYYNSDQTLNARKDLYDRFFDKILKDYLNLLLEKENQNIRNLLSGLQQEEDWEFRFILNFFLRDEHFTDAPYQRLLSKVNEFIKTI